MIETVLNLISHPYVMSIYGVVLWQAEQFVTQKTTLINFIQNSQAYIYRSLVWVGLVVVFDDEILHKYNEWAAVDYKEPPLYMYLIAGFFIDFIRSKVMKKIE